MEHVKCVPMLLKAPSSSTIIPPSAVAAAPSASSSTSTPIASAAMSESGSHPHPLHRIGLPVLMARRVHSQYVLCSSSLRPGAWCYAPATTGDCRGHMRDVQGVRLREEQYISVDPVDEDMTRRREDVGGATLCERSGFLGFGGKKGSDGL
jgi:hypothetical protein